MEAIFKKIVRFKLKLLAKIYLARFSPRVIIIAGTTNRHWAKDKVVSAIGSKGLHVRGNRKNFNAEIGLPLSILGLAASGSEKGRLGYWADILWGGFLSAIGPGKRTDYLVLEMAIDRPRDMDYLLGIAKPDIAVFTTITLIYPENFKNLDQIFSEYKKLAAALSKDGLAVINADDARIAKLKEIAPAKVITYGLENESADFRASGVGKTVDGQKFDLYTGKSKVASIKIDRFGAHHVYASVIGEIIKRSI